LARHKQFSERRLIDWIRCRGQTASANVEIGPGDDTALVRMGSERLLMTVDTIAEGVDFTLPTASPRQIGRKALAINLSDIAAMGGRPSFCVASVALTRGIEETFARELYKGLRRAADRYGCPLVGGDVTTWDGGVVVTVAAGGVLAGKKAVRRNGARPGDLVLVTGTLGGSILGGHLRFTPRLAEGAWLAEMFPPTAMIDISDGLGVDSGHLAEESGCAISIEARGVPVSTAARRLAGESGKSALEHAVGDGEDFELLLTLPAAMAARCIEAWSFRTRLSVIGKVSKGAGVRLVHNDGSEERIDTKGYQHIG